MQEVGNYLDIQPAGGWFEDIQLTRELIPDCTEETAAKFQLLEDSEHMPEYRLHRVGSRLHKNTKAVQFFRVVLEMIETSEIDL